eukprot:CAMPEP_0184318652 /NCGR_PEP_ID=MMETSP1049-20130417/103837_1 /TAXON_ID=77928 /ORGANISM="Proteomonas sulcata, Strain CCMP704" /LENGTH=44 /DNA_ID= /DNA_START= /DNA_END= /DNA_ORIENTATION=
MQALVAASEVVHLVVTSSPELASIPNSVGGNSKEDFEGLLEHLE